MTKKILLGLVASMAVVGGVVAMSAFEAHVVNVTARIENALSVVPDAIPYGTVFPEEVLLRDLMVKLSPSFLLEPDAEGVDYVIKQKPKCANSAVNPTKFGRVTETADGLGFVCEDGQLTILPILCPYLSKLPDREPANDGSLAAFHGPITGWTPANTETHKVIGRLAKPGDMSDRWTIDLAVPCFEGQCAQDNVIPPAYQADPDDEKKVFGCDLWIEVTGIDRFSTTPPPAQ
jgi:hypothetical protein